MVSAKFTSLCQSRAASGEKMLGQVHSFKVLTQTQQWKFLGGTVLEPTAFSEKLVTSGWIAMVKCQIVSMGIRPTEMCSVWLVVLVLYF